MVETMKRYTVIGESFDFLEVNEGDVIFYDDFVHSILARIKELETEIENEDSEYSIVSCWFAIKELKRLIE